MRLLLVFICFISFCSCQNKTTARETASKKDSAVVITNTPPKAEAVIPREQLLGQIKAMEKELFASQTMDVEKAKKIIHLYDLYHRDYYKYPECADYMFKAGEISENINQAYRAAEFYKMCLEYGKYKLRPECMFRLANVYDYKLSDFINAKEYYQMVIDQYPKTNLAKDAQAAITMMSRSDRDIIKDFEQKNGVK